MIVFESLIQAGARVAATSGVAEGDCALRADTAETRARYLAKAGVPEPGRAVCVAQVHGNRVMLAGEENAGRGATARDKALGEADGIATHTPGLPICVSVADCVPVLLYCPRPLSGAVLHSGREGTFQNIAQAGVQALVENFGCKPANIVAAIGPSICAARYEVSEEIADRFLTEGYPVQGRHLDLTGIIQQQLLDCGVPLGAIVRSTTCTFNDADYHSFRRSGGIERNLAVLML